MDEGARRGAAGIVPADPPAVERRATADGSFTLFSEEYAQEYGSRHGAESEARHVFLEGSGAAARLSRGLPTAILEVGFGTGLNFFLTSQAAQAGEGDDRLLRYVALEKRLLPAEVIRGLGYDTLAPQSVSRYLELRSALPATPRRGDYRLRVGRAELELRLGDAAGQELDEEAFHAVYLDAFSPESNPELWSDDFLERLQRALKPGGRLVSYSVKGAVRRTLERLGLTVSKRPGPTGGKREMLLAQKPPRTDVAG